MSSARKNALREQRSQAYRQLLSTVSEMRMVSSTSAAALNDCLCDARLRENSAAAALALRAQLIQEGMEGDRPAELSDAVIAKYLADAAHLYAVGALKHLQASNRQLAFRYYHRAAQCARKAAAFAEPGDGQVTANIQEYAGSAAVVRQRLALRSICRRKLSLGLLRRVR
jgi:hypothetical protein